MNEETSSAEALLLFRNEEVRSQTRDQPYPLRDDRSYLSIKPETTDLITP